MEFLVGLKVNSSTSVWTRHCQRRPSLAGPRKGLRERGIG